MTILKPIEALIFDLDGTLVDTESQTDGAIDAVLARRGIYGFVLPASETRGRTWAHVAERIRVLTQTDISCAELSAELLAQWNIATARVAEVPGASEAIRAAALNNLRLSVVSSSPRSVINRFLDSLEVAQVVDPRARIGGDDVRNGKPDPEGFLTAAHILEVDPTEALVFEDSRAGLLAARAAGMRSVFVMRCAADVAENAALATAAITDYGELPYSFWTEPAVAVEALRVRIPA